MSSLERAAPPKRWMTLTGWVLSVLSGGMMFMSASMKLSHAAKFVDDWVHKFGYPESVLTPIGIAEVLCALLYLVPQTSVLGAVLLTGYLGGAVASHVRIGDPGFVTPFVLGVLAWGGLFLRDARVRALLPLRRN